VRFRRIPLLIATAIGALVLAACGTDQPDEAAPAQPEELPDELGDGDLDLDDLEGELDGEMDLDDLFGDQEMPDPNEHVEDGVFRGDGIVLPIPDGFELEPNAYLQGLVAAVTPDGLQQIAGQAVDTDTMPDQALGIEELAESNEEQFGPSVSDEETDVDGATRARLMHFDGIPAQMEGDPELSLVLIIAEDGEGEVAIFNYVAPSEDFDEAEAEDRLTGVGFDPDSSPPEPEPMPTP
jgi:hypothetical protein